MHLSVGMFALINSYVYWSYILVRERQSNQFTSLWLCFCLYMCMWLSIGNYYLLAWINVKFKFIFAPQQTNRNSSPTIAGIVIENGENWIKLKHNHNLWAIMRVRSQMVELKIFMKKMQSFLFLFNQPSPCEDYRLYSSANLFFIIMTGLCIAKNFKISEFRNFGIGVIAFLLSFLQNTMVCLSKGKWNILYQMSKHHCYEL